MTAEIIAAIAQAAAKLYTAYTEREQNRREISDFAALIAANSKSLVQEIESVLRRSVDAQVISDCENRMQALSVFFKEYANNSLDIDKLRTIDQETMFILAQLDDPNVSLPAITLYLSVATLRIDALALKAEFEPGDRANAKAQALRALEYTKEARRLLENVPDTRVSVDYREICTWSRVSEDTVVPYCRVWGFVRLDGKKVLTKEVTRQGDEYGAGGASDGQIISDHSIKDPLISDAKHEIQSYISDKVNELKNSIRASTPFAVIDKCIAAWEAFSQG